MKAQVAYLAQYLKDREDEFLDYYYAPGDSPGLMHRKIDKDKLEHIIKDFYNS